MQIKRYLFSILIFSTFASSQESQTSQAATDLLEHVRVRLAEDIRRQPRYTCLQDISRQTFHSSSKEKLSCSRLMSDFAEGGRKPPLISRDKLRVDVAILNDGEIQSWHDAPRFSDSEVRSFLGYSPLGTGDFGAFVAAIFRGTSSVIFLGTRSAQGRLLFDYSYSVPDQASNYRIKVGPTSVIAAYEGSFTLDPQTTDITELTVRTNELPRSLPYCQAKSQIGYERLDIRGTGVLVPRTTKLELIYRSGKEVLSETSYSNCHEYSSTSKLRFDDIDESAPVSAPNSPKAPENRAPQLPESPFRSGANFDCRILTSITSDSVAGSPINAILRSQLRGKDKAVLAPRGAKIQGRIVRLVEHTKPTNYFEVGIRLDSVEVGGTKIPLYAVLADQAAPPINPFEWDNPEFQLANLPRLPPPNVGVLFFTRSRLELHDWDSAWITATSDVTKDKKLSQQDTKTKESLKKFILAIKYSQQATALLWANDNKSAISNTTWLFERYSQYPDLQRILSLRRKAIEVGELIDPKILDSVYPGLGDEFKRRFLNSLSLFVHGCEMQAELAGTAQAQLFESGVLSQEWVEWYKSRRKAIEEAVNLYQLNSEWTSVSPNTAQKQDAP